MIQVEQILQSKYPALAANHEFITRPTLALLRQLMREQELNAFLLQHHDLEGLEFLAKLLEYFNLSYSVVEGEKDNIPAEGRVVVVANHPLGGLDGIALLPISNGNAGVELHAVVRKLPRTTVQGRLARRPPQWPRLRGHRLDSASRERRGKWRPVA